MENAEYAVEHLCSAEQRSDLLTRKVREKLVRAIPPYLFLVHVWSAAFWLGVLFCRYIAQMDLPLASVIRILLICWCNTAYRPEKWAHLVVITWEDTSQVIRDSQIRLGWASRKLDPEQTRKPYRLVLFEKLHCVYLEHFGVVANFHLRTSTRLEWAFSVLENILVHIRWERLTMIRRCDRK